MAVGGAHERRHMVDERALQLAFKYLLFVLHERLRTLALEQSDGTGTHIHNLLVVVGDALLIDAVEDMAARVVAEEAQQQTACLVVGEDAQLVSVLDVHYLVADVIGSLNKIHQRMACIAQRFALSREAQHTEVVGDTLKRLLLEAEEAELAFLAGALTRVRILHDGSQRRVSHHEAAVAASVEAVREQSEGVGVTLEVREVLPHLRRHTRLQRQSPTLAKERLYSLLAGVTERRIAHVVRQTRRAHDGAKLLEERTREFGTNTLQGSRHVVAKRHAHTRHFERVSQSVVHEDAARQREHLCLVLHAAEGRREDKAVVVALELRAVVVALRVAQLLSETLVRYELLPVHCHSGFVLSFIAQN